MDEMIDVLDARGAPSGVTKAKHEVHRDGDWHRSVHVWMATPDGKVLIQRRSHDKVNYPGLWDVSAAGHVSAGETAIEAALREVEEELGLSLDAWELRPIGTLTEQHVLAEGKYLDNEHHDVFLVRRPVDLATLRLQEEEVEAVDLVSLDELPFERMVPHPEEYALLRAALRKEQAGSRSLIFDS